MLIHEDAFGNRCEPYETADLEAERTAQEARKAEEIEAIYARHNGPQLSADDAMAGPVGLSFPSDADEIEYCDFLADAARNRRAELEADDDRRQYEAEVLSGIRRIA